MTQDQLDLAQLQTRYNETRRPMELKLEYFHLALWGLLVFPGLFINFYDPFMRGIAWESLIAILLNWGGRRFFGTRQFKLHHELLVKTDPKYSTEYMVDSITILRVIFADLENPDWKPKFYIGNLSKSRQKLLIICLIFHFCLAVVYAVTQIFGIIGLVYFKIVVLTFGFILLFVNIINEIRMVFGNMKILHHVSFWYFQAQNDPESKNFRLKIIGEFFIATNLFLTLIIFGQGLSTGPIILCFAVLVYSSTYPEKYYQNVSPRMKWINRLNENIIVTPFIIIFLCFLIWPEGTNLVYEFISFNPPPFLPVFLPAVILLEIACVYIWNNFIQGKFKLPEDFSAVHSLFVPLGGKNSKITFSRILQYGVFFGFSIVIFLQIIATSIISKTPLLDILRIIFFMLAAFIIVRGVLSSIHRVGDTASQIGTLMTTYTWYHKKEELRVHYWEFTGSPMSLVFPGVVLVPTFLIINDLLPARTFFFTWSVAMKAIAFTWVIVSLSFIIYLVGTLILLSILAPHFVWHATALTTIPQAQIAELKSHPLFASFRHEFRVMNLKGYLGLSFLILLFIPTLTGVYTILVILSMITYLGAFIAIYFIISEFVPRFLDLVMVPIELRESARIKTEYLVTGKKVIHWQDDEL